MREFAFLRKDVQKVVDFKKRLQKMSQIENISILGKMLLWTQFVCYPYNELSTFMKKILCVTRGLNKKYTI